MTFPFSFLDRFCVTRPTAFIWCYSSALLFLGSSDGRALVLLAFEELARVVMYSLHEGAHIFWVHVRVKAVTQISDVALGAKALQHPPHDLGDALLITHKQREELGMTSCVTFFFLNGLNSHILITSEMIVEKRKNIRRHSDNAMKAMLVMNEE